MDLGNVSILKTIQVERVLQDFEFHKGIGRKAGG